MNLDKQQIDSKLSLVVEPKISRGYSLVSSTHLTVEYIAQRVPQIL